MELNPTLFLLLYICFCINRYQSRDSSSSSSQWCDDNSVTLHRIPAENWWANTQVPGSTFTSHFYCKFTWLITEFKIIINLFSWEACNVSILKLSSEMGKRAKEHREITKQCVKWHVPSCKPVMCHPMSHSKFTSRFLTFCHFSSDGPHSERCYFL